MNTPRPSHLARWMRCEGPALLPTVETPPSKHATAGTEAHKWWEPAVTGEPLPEGQPPEGFDVDAPAVVRLREMASDWTAEAPLSLVLESGRRIQGTADLVSPGSEAEEAIVVDVKTGRPLGPPGESEQLLTYALALTRASGASHARLVYLYTSPSPHLVEAVVGPWELDGWADVLDARLQRLEERRASGEPPRLAVGPWCRYCPAALTCPAQASLLRHPPAPPDFATWESPEAVQALLVQLDATEQALRDARAALYLVAREVPLELPGGKQWGLTQSSSEWLDGAKTREVLAGLDALLAATVVQLEPSATKHGLKRAVKELLPQLKALGLGTNAAEVERAVLERLRAGGAVQVRTRETFGVLEAP